MWDEPRATGQRTQGRTCRSSLKERGRAAARGRATGSRVVAHLSQSLLPPLLGVGIDGVEVLQQLLAGAVVGERDLQHGLDLQARARGKLLVEPLTQGRPLGLSDRIHGPGPPALVLTLGAG